MTEEKIRPFGNLSFDEYTLGTEAERLAVALQAAMKVSGYSKSSPAWKKLSKLRKAMKKKHVFSEASYNAASALQAEMKIAGIPENSDTWRKLQNLRKDVKMRKLYSFSLIPKGDADRGSEEVSSVYNSGPSEDLSGIIGQSISDCLGIPLKGCSITNNTLGCAVVSVVCGGPSSSLRALSADQLNTKFRAICYPLGNFEALRVLNVKVDPHDTKCQATVEVVYK